MLVTYKTLAIPMSYADCVTIVFDTSTEINSCHGSSWRNLDPVSDELRMMFQVVNYVVLCGSISFFGIGANIINIAVFYRQGFKDGINISLFGKLKAIDFSQLVVIYLFIRKNNYFLICRGCFFVVSISVMFKKKLNVFPLQNSSFENDCYYVMFHISR